MPELTFQGETFALEDSYAVMMVMEFAIALKAESNNSDLAAMYELLQHLILPGEWERFRAHAVATRADSEAMLVAVQEAIGAIAERPTSLPSVSSDGHSTTPVNSVADSSLRVVKRLEGQGRADLALQVKQQQEFLAG